MQCNGMKTKQNQRNKTKNTETELSGSMPWKACCLHLHFLSTRKATAGGAPDPGLSHEQEQTASAPEFL